MIAHLITYSPNFAPEVEMTQIMRGQPDRDTAVMVFETIRERVTIRSCEAIEDKGLTKAQKVALVAARDLGDANATTYARDNGEVVRTTHPYRTPRFVMIHELYKAGLLGLQRTITDAGLRFIGEGVSLAQAEREGWSAGCASLGLLASPYALHTDHRAAWDRGYQEAYAQG